MYSYLIVKHPVHTISSVRSDMKCAEVDRVDRCSGEGSEMALWGVGGACARGYTLCVNDAYFSTLALFVSRVTVYSIMLYYI